MDKGEEGCSGPTRGGHMKKYGDHSLGYTEIPNISDQLLTITSTVHQIYSLLSTDKLKL